MRFVLYFFTWAFIVQTVGNLLKGDVDQFVTGLFLSGLMVWWSISVLNRRKRKLARSNGEMPPKKKRKGGQAKADESLADEAPHAGASRVDTQTQEPIVPGASEPAVESLDESDTFDGTGLTFTAEGDDEEALENEPKVERPRWRDAQGKELHVGARVTFFANSRGESVAIPGVLLGESEGKALIEVGSGALLPKNDYAIPWNVVSLVD